MLIRSFDSEVAAGWVLINSQRRDHIQPIGILHPRVRRETPRRNTIRP
jgi:hypothetical protein